METSEQKIFYVKSMRLAGFLMQRGFVIHSMKPDSNLSRRNIFLFTNCPELHDAIKDYKSLKEIQQNDEAK